jgi:uncharacterized protein with PIN domain
MQIINTSSGPAILTDDSDVVMPSDIDGVAKVIAVSPGTVTELVAALEAKVQASVPVIVKVKALEVLSAAETAVLNMGQVCHMNVENVSRAVALSQES